VYKPAASGCTCQGERLWIEDAARLWEAAGRPHSIESVCPQAFAAPLAPHLAARAEGRQIDEALLLSGLEPWAESDIVLIEGAGGLMSPIGEQIYVADLALEFGYPLVVVAPNRIGVINQTLQTLITAATFRDGLTVAGIVLNDCGPPEDDPSCESNPSELLLRCVPPLLAHVLWQDDDALAELDWAGLTREASIQDI
jgi:dethiobiotin synthetase